MAYDLTPLTERIHPLRRFVRLKRPSATSLVRDPVPWVDATLLVLLVILIQTAAMHRPGVEVDLPVVSTTVGAHYGALVLSVPGEGFLFLADERVHERNLGDQLAAAFTGRANRELVIEADASLTHRYLMELYSIAVSNGASKIVLATRRPAGEGAVR